MSLSKLLREVRACTICANVLPSGVRPVVQAARGARLLIIGQAPGRKVHETGIPWNDASGERLRAWTQLEPGEFYDEQRVAILPMGFCYPGTGSNGADRPPRPECARLWHRRLLDLLPAVRCTILVGLHAQRHYLRSSRKATLTETVRAYAEYGPLFFPLPHPSWRSVAWTAKNRWFEETVLPDLRKVVRASMRR